MDKLIVAVLICAIVAAMPYAIIWALNTLFHLSIPFTIWTWLATLVLSGPFFGGRKA